MKQEITNKELLMDVDPEIKKNLDKNIEFQNFTGTQKITYDPKKKNFSVHVEFKAELKPDTKLHKVRQELRNAVEQLFFQNYQNSFATKDEEEVLTLQDLSKKKNNEQLVVKNKKDNKKYSTHFDTRNVKFLLIPSRVISHENEVLLGQGGFGKVMKRKLKSFDIAEKIMLNYDKDKFIKEAEITHHLRSTRSLTIIGLEEEESKYNMVLEFIPGNSLDGLIRSMSPIESKKPRNELLYILHTIDLAKGIDFLTRRKIIHRDLKPENCMLNKEFDLFIIDFGVSKETQNSQTKTKEIGTMTYFGQFGFNTSFR